MKQTFFIFLSAFLLLSCQNKETKTNVEQEKVVEEPHSFSDSPLYLNNGKPWLINEEMKPHISRGEEALKTYIDKKDTDYKNLSQTLNDENKKLIESCTMTGESHEVLHEWLSPHLELATELENAKSQKEAEKTVQKLHASFETLHKYFK